MFINLKDYMYVDGTKGQEQTYSFCVALTTENYTGCPKIKLALGYLTIVSTSDSQEHFRGPNRF